MIMNKNTMHLIIIDYKIGKKKKKTTIVSTLLFNLMPKINSILLC